MSHFRKRTILERMRDSVSLRSIASNFLRNTMAGQKLFLFRKDLPRVINVSFNEKTCMYRCKMCPYEDTVVRDMYTQGSEMSFETLKNLVASVPNGAEYSFDISAIGETLAFKQLPEFIGYMKAQRPRVNTIISTNGLLLDEDVARRLVNSRLDSLQFSLFAADAKDHEFITGSKSYERVCENIRTMWRVRQEMGSRTPYIQTFMMESAETKDKIDDFIRYWSQYVDKAFTRPIYNLGRTIDGMSPVFVKTPATQRYPCIMPWYSTSVRSNGDVLACYMFHWHKDTKDYTLGNINEQTLSQIWNGPRMQAFRRAHSTMKLDDHPVCQQCDLWDAYTNVWEPQADGTFRYSTVKPLDWFRPAPEYRGA